MWSNIQSNLISQFVINMYFLFFMSAFLNPLQFHYLNTSIMYSPFVKQKIFQWQFICYHLSALHCSLLYLLLLTSLYLNSPYQVSLEFTLPHVHPTLHLILRHVNMLHFPPQPF